ncbi:DUF397 domain-containing protein [Kitasatospora cheerisanensis]|uniref:DUF397 domain-containing protein n=1 Tax=Kitasatospora cheerisanensis TaxID=81942 RepID=UPI001FCB3FAD|nr:DUF397 domain-containing protein [Kitasatospora cheerisanensis]
MDVADEFYNGMPADGIDSPHPWQVARKSQGSGECVELRRLTDGRVAVRHSKDPSGPALIFTRGEIDAWLDGAKRAEFDHLLA